mgnify:CR=1 FL=1
MDPARMPGKQSGAGLCAGYSIAAVMLASLVFAVTAQSDEAIPPDNEHSTRLASNEPGQDGSAPRRHFRLSNPAKLSNEEAEAVYGEFREKMARGYASSGVKAAREYQKWQRYNLAPFRSATHGRRFVNHYANPLASAYGKFENAGTLPVGSIIAKDSLAVIDDDKIFPGPLFLMEKMPKGFNYVSADWRYTMIMPDGSLFGTTNGVGSGKVGFCIGCHLAVEKQDHLYFPPKQYRRK